MDVAFCDLQLVAFLRVKNRSPLSLIIDHKVIAGRHKQQTRSERPSLANYGLRMERGVGNNLGQPPTQSRNLLPSISDEINV